MKTLCIYHGNCADGFGAAWVVRRALGEANVEFHAGVYQDPPPDVAGRDVVIVDFSYKQAVLYEMAKSAKSVLILDHHKSAAEDLKGLPSAGVNYSEWEYRRSETTLGMGTLFDMGRSGAGIAWDFFFPGEPRPHLINHIEDRDLWSWALPHSREISAALFSYTYSFAVWDKLISVHQHEPMFLVQEGEAIERKHHKDIAELIKVVTRPMRIGGAVVPMANLPYTYTSDAGELLCGCSLTGQSLEPQPDDQYLKSIHPFAGCYWDTPAGRVFSLRSREDGADVSAVAKLYGGGGHEHAAGFRAPHDSLDQFEVRP